MFQSRVIQTTQSLNFIMNGEKKKKERKNVFIGVKKRTEKQKKRGVKMFERRKGKRRK